MKQVSAETLAQVILWLSVLIGLVFAAVLVVQRLRGSAAEKGQSANELLSNFQEMKTRGDLSDADFRKIKSVLGAHLQGELKDGKDKV